MLLKWLSSLVIIGFQKTVTSTTTTTTDRTAFQVPRMARKSWLLAIGPDTLRDGSEEDPRRECRGVQNESKDAKINSRKYKSNGEQSGKDTTNGKRDLKYASKWLLW